MASCCRKVNEDHKRWNFDTSYFLRPNNSMRLQIAMARDVVWKTCIGAFKIHRIEASWMPFWLHKAIWNVTFDIQTIVTSCSTDIEIICRFILLKVSKIKHRWGKQLFFKKIKFCNTLQCFPPLTNLPELPYF